MKKTKLSLKHIFYLHVVYLLISGLTWISTSIGMYEYRFLSATGQNFYLTHNMEYDHNPIYISIWKKLYSLKWKLFLHTCTAKVDFHGGFSVLPCDFGGAKKVENT